MPTFLRYEHAGAVGYGELSDSKVLPLEGEFAHWRRTAGPPIALADLKLLAPVAPSKVVAIGPNYKAALPSGMAIPERPMYWIKPASALNHPEGVIELPPGVPAVNHEVELGIVIGRRATRVPRAAAHEYILGYTCVNDVTAGDFSAPAAFGASVFMVYGKIFDGFAPIGPWIVTDLDPSNLHVECRVNGEVRQSHDTSDHIFTPAQLVEFVSHVVTLLPGDVISTGAPPNVQPIRHGDIVEIEIEGIGVLRNHARNRADTPEGSKSGRRALS